ncbi:MAG: hypothetical protein CL477_20200 [Acidobacteria bacterium]|jgi:hypothetical protein|nr:hypothetical protein [Acidobacteriota bacterium]MBQ02990.1 hypothetical protein [Acidobacteriota bacterium]MDP7339492.1 hypothetical protein [Vicinamibacterales bacterium]MDP7480210.1 hypothetical protein [Vicinamibacterales bacterium]|tara:strand:- start:2854 stop:3621 length:768 start_codon:yes stop_codon:yes gene_type:complete
MMSETPAGARRRLLALVALACVATSTTAWAQDIKATVQIEAPGAPAMSMDYWMSDDAVRIDIAQPQAVSLVWMSGSAPGMLMIQHGERRYIEWGEQEFQMMRQMMERMPGAAGGGGSSPGVDPDSVRFEPTGQTETIGPWSATAVGITGMEAGQEATIWVAAELDSGLFELFARMGDALQAMQMPMFGGGASGPQQQLMRYRQMKDAAGLPAGGVVRLNADATITLQALEEGPFADDPFTPPAGYEKMQMPNIPE